ncbi:transcriptional regulator [Pseudarthrobacter sp. J64]|uniref:helix-turn-helix transcriptional regulator n=1 Tax=Pseudarthrobacter sp. J64 TaxID=3116485 RepID=UPI002E81F8A8|nr:transcriptional regulator [Pseudarthrobacter sp. J64]MEE2568277.1 transcriptional regulator [Pseudarthrobacter sp. J64]
MARQPLLQRIASIASLADRKRRQLFEFVAASPVAVGRDEAAFALGVPRSTASFHLDRLVQDGLLAVEFLKPPGKAGPGSGRPAKMYRKAASEVGAFVPDRNYDLAGELMAAAIEQSAATGRQVGDSLQDVARSAGMARSAGSARFDGFLAAEGYGPEPDGDGGYILTNCPFHRLADGHPSVVCAMNGAFLAGAASGCGEPEDRVVGNNAPGQCCARIRATNQPE